MTQRIATRDEWLEARLALLDSEKALTRAREAVAEQRRSLPWVKVEEGYRFETERGIEGLAELFGSHSQLIVQHFMFAPEWTDGCKSCSFWSDNLQGALRHLAARDVTFVAVSQAPLATLLRFRERMGWRHDWVSSALCNFSNDYRVWYTPEQIAAGETAYNFQPGLHYGEHAPGFSVFARNAAGDVFHTYSCYARGLDPLNGTYQLLDLVPKGRDEDELSYPMDWVRLHDDYEGT